MSTSHVYYRLKICWFKVSIYSQNSNNVSLVALILFRIKQCSIVTFFKQCAGLERCQIQHSYGIRKKILCQALLLFHCDLLSFTDLFFFFLIITYQAAIKMC